MRAVSKDEAYRVWLHAASKVRKLLAIANKHPDTHEGSSARKRAEVLIAKYGLDAESLKPLPERRVYPEHDNFAAFAGAIKRNYPARDSTDYTQYNGLGKKK
jgi:hypothetical protein